MIRPEAIRIVTDKPSTRAGNRLAAAVSDLLLIGDRFSVFADADVIKLRATIPNRPGEADALSSLSAGESGMRIPPETDSSDAEFFALGYGPRLQLHFTCGESNNSTMPTTIVGIGPRRRHVL